MLPDSLIAFFDSALNALTIVFGRDRSGRLVFVSDV